MKKFSTKSKTIASAALAFGLIIPQVGPTLTYQQVMAAEDQDIVSLRLIETTDLHANIMNFDYYKNATTQAYGLTKAATTIAAARAEATNSLLFDNGDTIQGSAVGDYVVSKGLMVEGYVHPIIRAMNLIGYDGQTLGNHEFNYGLDFLNEAMDDANHPVVNANVYDANTNQNYFTPFEIITKQVVDGDGETHTIKIGVTGFVPPDIMKWDAKHLEGKLVVKDIVEAANLVIPQMKAAGADVIVALAHTGIADYDQNGEIKPYTTGAENAGYYLAQIDGIDAVLTGHQHQSFPNAAKPSFKDNALINNTTGTIAGTPVAMPGSWGNNIGLIDLTLELVNGVWTVTNGTSALRSTANDAQTPAIDQAVAVEHAATLEYMNEAVGQLDGDLNTFFSLVKDNAAMEIVNRAQTWYIKNALKGTQYENLPVLSAAAPFKAGGRSGSEAYTNVPSGPITIRGIADLYLYDNNVVHALKVTGADIKEWLEWTAGQFNTIDPYKTTPQDLINGGFPTYNFDVIDGVTYEIDVTQAPKYDSKALVINPTSSRIKNLQFNGKAVTDNMEFIVATNDYRSGSVFFNTGMAKTIFKAPDSNRQVVSDYVKENGTISASVNNNWSFSRVNTGVNVTFQSNVLGAQKNPYSDISYTNTVDASNFGIFKIDLGTKAAPAPTTPTTPTNPTNPTNPTTPNPEQPTTPAPTTPAPVFTDVKEGHWAKSYIDTLVSKNIINGVSATSFNPEGALTRAQFVSMLVRALGLSDGKLSVEKEIELAFENGITTLAPANFGGSTEVTREQMAAMLVRAYEKKIGKSYEATTAASFKDSNKISKAFTADVAAAKELGFIVGNKNGTYAPKQTANRAQAARVVYAFLEKK